MLALILLFACGGERSSPEGSVRTFLDALEARDTARFRSSFTPETRQIVAQIEQLSGEVGGASGQPAITIEEWCRAFCDGTVEGSTLHGDSATVRVRIGGVVEEIPVVRQDNEWRIDLAAKYAPAVEMLRLIQDEGTGVAPPDTTPSAP
jgi:hypothetical protein